MSLSGHDCLRGGCNLPALRVQVDLVLSGHVHAYARTCNVLDERCLDPADGGMTHFTVGARLHRPGHGCSQATLAAMHTMRCLILSVERGLL